MTPRPPLFAARSGNRPTFSAAGQPTVLDIGDDPRHDRRPDHAAAQPWLATALRRPVGHTLHKAHGGARWMPIRSIPLIAPPLPPVLQQDAIEPPGAAAEPAIPFWLALLSGVSLWLNRLFLGLVLALVGFTLWHWWQG
ncbi:hypothetical protein thsps117_01150 [Pseudomonas sp. No.117]